MTHSSSECSMHGPGMKTKYQTTAERTISSTKGENERCLVSVAIEMLARQHRPRADETGHMHKVTEKSQSYV